MASFALARVYQQSFESHPYGTLAITNGTLNAVGDVVAQIAQNLFQPQNEYHHPVAYDIPRTLRFFAFGLGMGPLIGRWNLFLEQRFPLRFLDGHKTGSVSVKALTKRVASDQIIMAPIGLAIFLGSMGLMEGRDRNHIREKYRDLYKPLLKTNWQVWPVAQLINFRYMPLPYRVPFQSTCGVFWTLYISIANSKEAEKQDHRDAMERTLH